LLFLLFLLLLLRNGEGHCIEALSNNDWKSLKEDSRFVSRLCHVAVNVAMKVKLLLLIIGPKASKTSGIKWCVSRRSSYFLFFRSSAMSAAPACCRLFHLLIIKNNFIRGLFPIFCLGFHSTMRILEFHNSAEVGFAISIRLFLAVCLAWAET